MRILLDTQIFIWHSIQHPKLNADIRKMIDDPANQVFLSHISLFEIAVKQKIGKLPEFPLTVEELQQFSVERNFILLPISATHIAAYERIPLSTVHRDPFDRLLLATALAEAIPVVSADDHFPQYSPLVSVIPG